MGAKRGNHEQLSQAVEVFSLGDIRDASSHNGEGSNVLILPGKKRNKTKGKDKVCKRTKAKEAPALSKRKISKLQKLQEEKEKKLLFFKSIAVLHKYKIKDDVYSILRSSGTIGQAETAREKRRLAVQYSKAGLELPENVSLFKKEKPPFSSENELVSKPSDEGNLAECHDKNLYLKKQLTKEDYGFQTPNKFPEKDDHSDALHVKHSEKYYGKGAPIPMENDGSCQEHSLQSNAGLLVNGAIGANVCPEKLEDDMHNAQGHVPSSAIVVQISRPHEVEEKRRNLPIIMMEQEIMEAINEHPVLILCGETGCGKTTQVPQFLYEAGYGSSNNSDWKGVIGITQPRRVAVLATAKRVSYELGLRLGREVGFQVRHDKMIGSSSLIKFMTDGILLREAQSDFLLRRYSVVILDEAHERSLNTDILIGMLSRIIKIRQELYEEQQKKILSGAWISPDDMITRLKLVLMSATLRVEDFVSNKRLFHVTPPVLEVAVRQFPVTIHFSRKTPDDYLGQAYKKVLSIHKRLPPGGILVFVTGQREVELLCKKLRKACQKFSDNNLKKMGSETPAYFEPNMQDIDEAFGLENDVPNQQFDRFSSYEEDDLEAVEQSSDPDTDSEGTEDGEYEGKLGTQDQEENSSMLSFLRNPESLSSLKAAFENLSGKFSNQSSVKEQDLQCTSVIKQSDAEPTAVLRPLYVLPLYAMLPASQQLRVFETVPEGERLVVVATNVAETSLTIPGIKYVVDTGKEKVKNYNYGNGMATYEVQWISKASAEQRAGRAGRTGPGHCYRLYSSAAFGKDDVFPKFSCPEISKIPVDGVLLLMKYMGIDKVANFPFPTPPEVSALREAEACLTAIGALNGDGRLTSLGRAMAQYPMSPRHSRMILTVIQILRSRPGFDRANFVLGYSVAAAAALSFPNPFLMQLEVNQGTEENGMVQEDGYHQDSKKKIKAMSKESRAKLCNPSSDALTVAYALQLFELAKNSFEFCRNNSLHLKTMEEMSKLRKQILQLIFHQGKSSHEFSWDHGSLKDVENAWLVHSPKHPLQMSEDELIGQAICAGWADRVAKRSRTVSGSSQKEHKVRAMRYQSCASDDAVYLHRWSSVSQTAPEFVVYSELLCTKRPYMHGVTEVKADWLVRYTKPLCRFSTPLTDPKPYYEPLSDRLFCWVSPTFGRHNWQLPLHSLPIKNEDLRLSVFACALLEGDVLPCLRSAKSFLAAPPLTMLRPEALGQRRVGDLLSRLRMGSRTIDSRAKLKEAWGENPMYLHLEIRNWFQDRFQGQFCVLWEQMLQEASLEGFELFPKRAKKDRRITR